MPINSVSLNSLRFAAIDIGSNSVKFIVVEKSPDSSDFKVLKEESHTTRLAADLIRTGRLADESMDRTLEVLKKISDKAQELGVAHFEAVATSAVRDSDNRKDFLKRSRDVLGFSIKLYSGDEEAETVFAGVARDPFFNGQDLFVMDIGGGSAEWIQGENGKIARRISLPLGCVRLRERFIPSYPLSATQLKTMRTVISGQLSEALVGFSLGNRKLVGTGGTATCLSAVEQVIPDFNPALIDHFTMDEATLESMLDRLRQLTIEELHLIPGLPSKRSDLIVPGTVLLLESMRLLGAKELTASVRGLRYGILAKLIHKNS